MIDEVVEQEPEPGRPRRPRADRCLQPYPRRGDDEGLMLDVRIVATPTHDTMRVLHGPASSFWARLDSNQGPTDYESAALTS